MESMEVKKSLPAKIDKTAFRAFLVDLDYAVLPGIALAAKIWKEELASIPLTLNDAEFCRYFLHSTPRRGAVSLATAAGARDQLDYDQVRGRVDARFMDTLSSADLAPRDGMAALLVQMEKRGAQPVFLSQLPADAVAQVVQRLGLADGSFLSVTVSPDRTVGFGSSAWKQALRQTHALEHKSLALTACAQSARGALFAGTKVVVVPDSLNAYEDTGGVDGRFDSASDPELLERLSDMLALELS